MGVYSPIYTRTSDHKTTKIYTGITPMLCLDTKTMTKRFVPFGRTNLGRTLAIPHFCLNLKLIERSKCHYNWCPRQNCTELSGINQGRDKRVYISIAS